MASTGRLGELLMRMGLIDALELRAMLSLQSELRRARRGGMLSPRLRLGRLLVESGIVDEATLGRALARQRASRMAIALSGVALSTAAAAPACAGDTAKVQVVASVMARAAIDSQRLPTAVIVTHEDVERGYVDLAEPVEIGIRSNHPVALGFSGNSSTIAGVDVTSGSTYIAQGAAGLRARTVYLQLRLKLAPGAQPGRLAFPVSVSLTPA